MTSLRLGFVGAGKVGSTLAKLLAAQGYAISGIYSPPRDHATTLAQQVGTIAFEHPADVVDHADLVFLTVPDDVIASVASLLISTSLVGKTIVHTSGAHSLEVLATVSEKGATIGGFHPAFPFAMDTKTLKGVTFAVEGSDERTLQMLQSLALSLDGVPLLIPQGQKALYHAALCICSNYTVTLYAIAERLLVSMGASKSQADNTLHPLLNATVKNLQRVGVPDALTGPLVRNDTGTIAAHLKSLAEGDRVLYGQLGQATFPLLEQRRLPTAELIALFAKESAL